MARGALAVLLAAATAHDRARALFDSLDADGDGVLTPDELAEQRRPARPFVHAFTERFGQRIPFDTFFRHLYRVHGLDEFLGLDGSGALDASELRLLLLGWGLPDRETDRYLAAYDDGDGQISFEGFYAAMGPTRRFAGHLVRTERPDRAVH
ncbi:hypothetical protein PV682_43745 [Streptomyces niveiscabiei]|uniref:hypothetical protein n=1 Tax=Streptomyces niveiscabiei TaxID=164115 RepID=UPI0029BA3B0B|nr:hypothetical protein [Streptomyces niveiscabiei]MDX3388303.1 hypothetical protein [Streptomyces niveiscabiei]